MMTIRTSVHLISSIHRTKQSPPPPFPLYLRNVYLRVSSQTLVYTYISCHLFTCYSFTAALSDTRSCTWETSRTYNKAQHGRIFLRVIRVQCILLKAIIRIITGLCGNKALSVICHVCSPTILKSTELCT